MSREHHLNLLAQAGGNWFDFEGLIRDIYVSGDLSPNWSRI